MAVVINGTSGITGNTGTLISATTIGVGGATPSASGAGITFPATQSASTDANTLDDYEEGTWTPTITADVDPTVTYSTRAAVYTKIGNIVHVWVYIQVGTRTGGSGNSYISGLPFTCGNVQGGMYNNWSNSGFSTNCVTAGHIPVSQARAYLVYYSGGATAQLGVSQINAGTQICMYGSYSLA